MGIPIEYQRLSTLMSKPLFKDNCRLSDYNIQNEQTILLKLVKITKQQNHKMIMDNFTRFQQHMTMDDASTLSINDYVDHRDKDGKYVLATIRDKRGSNLKIHYVVYEPWPTQRGIWSDYKVELHRFFHPYSVSQRSSHVGYTVKRGDSIDINPVYKHPGWKDGTIERFNVDSGQIQVSYEWMNKRYLYWSHTDDRSEIARFNTTKRTCIKCNTECDVQRMIKCSPSNHTYCSQCITVIRYSHLSLLNEVPRCIHSGCNAPLPMNNSDISESEMFAKYRTSTTFEEYCNMKHLINGYIGNIVIVPNEIISMIFDFHVLYFIKPNANACMTLDLPKLCNNQLLCVKCNEYYPTNAIICWSCCHHVVCRHCLLPYIQDCIDKYQEIPKCPEINCDQEMGQPNASCVYYYLTNRQLSFKNKLETLFYRKDKFECSYCLRWHSNDEVYTDKSRVLCQHKYNKECYDDYALYTTSVCRHSDCVRCYARCEICHKLSENRELIKWSVCQHKYHKRCALQYINEWIPKQKSIINVLLNNGPLIPLCIGKNCNKLLDVSCAQLFGVTHHQGKVLYGLRRDSILVDGNVEQLRDIINEDETIKNLLMEDDFSRF